MGVEGFDATGVGACMASIGDKGDGIGFAPWIGAGAIIDNALVVKGVKDGRLWWSKRSAFAFSCDGVCDSVDLAPTTSRSIVPSLPFSNIAVLVSRGGSAPATEFRSSYNTGENRTATLAFL